MPAKIKVDIEALVLKLLAQKPEISLHDVAHASGLSKSDERDRKAIRRVINSLIKCGVLEAKGAARAHLCKDGSSVKGRSGSIAREWRGCI